MKTSVILIVEDEVSQREVLSSKLSREGFEVLQAANGEEGLEMALSKKPNLILLDIVMPKMDGISMLRKLRSDQWGKTVKVLMLTNLSEAHVALEGQEFSGYLVKANWSIGDLVKEVRRYL